MPNYGHGELRVLMELETASYRITRTEMARIASLEYLRSFWWVVIGIPLFGIFALIFGQGILQVIGVSALLWPFSIPARSVLATSKPSRLFAGGVRMRLYDDRMEFLGETPGKNGKPYRMTLPLDAIRDVVQRGDFLLIRTFRLGFLPIRLAAFRTAEDLKVLSEIG
jgi:hypothetical protein